MGLHRRHRQPQGDDIDIDAAVEARVELMAGSVPDESVYLDSLRRRRDLSVLLLLDVSGSTAEPGTVGRTVHQQQLVAAANLDRRAARSRRPCRAVRLQLSGSRRGQHGAGQAIRRPPRRAGAQAAQQPRARARTRGWVRRSGTAPRSWRARGGTSRRLLVVLSDGLAYDHGYERDYGAADARRALTEARRRGTGCVCLTVGASTDVAALRRVFGSAAHAIVGRPDQLVGVIGPLFRSALRSAEVRRRVS